MLALQNKNEASVPQLWIKFSFNDHKRLQDFFMILKCQDWAKKQNEMIPLCKINFLLLKNMKRMHFRVQELELWGITVTNFTHFHYRRKLLAAHQSKANSALKRSRKSAYNDVQDALLQWIKQVNTLTFSWFRRLLRQTNRITCGFACT